MRSISHELLLKDIVYEVRLKHRSFRRFGSVFSAPAPQLLVRIGSDLLALQPLSSPSTPPNPLFWLSPRASAGMLLGME